MPQKRKIIVAVTGASGSIYARLLCQTLATCDGIGETAVIFTDNGEAVARFEDTTEWDIPGNFNLYENHDMFSAPASGSAGFDSMVIIPCSMGMAGRIANGISNDLISRAADVMLKERRRLILVTREAPLSTIHLRNMTALSECGAVICPASPSFYSKPGDIEALCMTIVERVVSLLGIEHPHYRWDKRAKF